MNNHNDFGLKKVDLNKRKLKKEKQFLYSINFSNKCINNCFIKQLPRFII